MKKRDFNDFSIEDIKEIARQAGLKAQRESLDAGLEVVYGDLQGNIYFLKKGKDGRVRRVRTIKGSSDSK